MKTMYSTSVTSVGGRNGTVKSADGVLDAEVRMPSSLGGAAGAYLNPETLFAAGYSACFNSALGHIIQAEKLTTGPTTVTAEVHLLQLDNGGFGLAVDVPGLDREKAQELVNKAHQVCPYSNATRNNIEVKITLK